MNILLIITFALTSAIDLARTKFNEDSNDIPIDIYTTDNKTGYVGDLQDKWFVSDYYVGTRNAVAKGISHVTANIGGQLRLYTTLLGRSKEKAIKDIKAGALTKGADSIVGVRIEVSEIAPNVILLLTEYC